jgi:hypothetical protein
VRGKWLRRDIIRPRNLHDFAEALSKPHRQLMSMRANDEEARRGAILF